MVPIYCLCRTGQHRSYDELDFDSFSSLGWLFLVDFGIVEANLGKLVNVAYHRCLVAIYESDTVESFAGFRLVLVICGSSNSVGGIMTTSPKV